jgi:hypothetical protein
MPTQESFGHSDEVTGATHACDDQPPGPAISTDRRWDDSREQMP